MTLYKGTHKVCPIITVGTTPTGTLSITQNGTYNVTNYASANVSVSGGFPGWTTLSSIGVDCSISEILDGNYQADAEIFQDYVASFIPADSMYISTTTVDSNNDTSGIAVFIINDVTYLSGSVFNDSIYTAPAGDIQPEFQYQARNYNIEFPEVDTTIANGEITIPGCAFGVYEAYYGSYQPAALIDLTFHFNI